MFQKFKIIGITFYPYSLLLIAGAVVCFLLFMWLCFKRHNDSFNENLFAMSMLVISMGVAVPASMLVDSLFKYIKSGKFDFGASTFYGGLLVALALFPLLLKLKKKREVPIYDRLCDLAPCIAAGHCLGRIGCFLGGCCFGSPVSAPLGVVFPENSAPYEYYGGAVAVHPTQLYEALFLFCLFLFLFFFAKKDAFPLYLILYGAGRIFIEFFRNDDRGGTGLPLSPAQLISIILIIVGSVIFAVKANRVKKE